MTKGIDTAIRYALLLSAGAVVVAMNIVAGNEEFTRANRFTGLAILGVVGLVVWPATALASRFETRRPFRLAWGKPPQPAADIVQPPAPESLSLPARYSLDVGNTAWALAGATLAAVVTFVVGFALASRANPDGIGLLIYILFAASMVVVARSVFRLATAGRALDLNTDSIVLGLPLGYVPPLTLRRSEIVAIETSEAMLALVTTDARRYELDPSHLKGGSLPATISAAWPGMTWRGWPAKPS